MQINKNYGQDRVISYLKSAIENKRLANTYLFIGPLGIDKLNIAIDFAKALNCDKAELVSGCSCQSCILIDKNQHPDVIIFGNSGSSIKIDEIRYIQQRLTLRAYMAKIKVVIVPDIERLTPDASNCFLKTLEEPSKNSLIILTASSASLVFPTILSRCHKINFSCSCKDIVSLELESMLGLDKNKSRCLAGFTSGRLPLAIELNKNNFFELRDKVIDLFLQSERRIVDSEFLSKISSKSDISLIFSIILTYLRDIRVLKTSQDEIAIINLDIIDKLKQSLDSVTVSDIDSTSNELMQAVGNIDRNLNMKLFLNYLNSKLTRV